MKYVLGIDQSTQGTKAVLFDQEGQIIARADCKHKQLIDENGYVSHNLEEIYHNVIESSRNVIEKAKIDPENIVTIGISNQRETTVLFDGQGTPLADAIVWQCSRSASTLENLNFSEEEAEQVRKTSGLVLSAYFPASKIRWYLDTLDLQNREDLHFGTIDTWVVYKLTGQFKTDVSNASRTQLFDIHNLQWSDSLCQRFGIDPKWLPEVCDSNANFGMTDLDGVLPHSVSIHAVMGDSHAALFGQGCHEKGNVKTTFGTGSSIMMNIGSEYQESKQGLTTSLAWQIDGQTDYVFEGNINYSGAVITWMLDDLGLIDNSAQSEQYALEANPHDETILVPAFSGLSAPYWNENARAMLTGMSRTTTKKELVKAGLESIDYQIVEILNAMASDSHLPLREVKVDGGPTKNKYLMQFLSDMARSTVHVSKQEELSAIGVAYLAGMSAGLYSKERLFVHRDYIEYVPRMSNELWRVRMERWYDAIERVQKERKKGAFHVDDYKRS